MPVPKYPPDGDPVTEQILERLLHKQEAKLKSHFDQSVQQLLAGLSGTANLSSPHQDFAVQEDEHEISLRDAMPPHLLSVVEKVREEHSQKQKPSQKSHTRQATLVLSEAIHSPTAIRLKVLRFVAETYEYVVDVLVLAYAISLGFEIDFKTSYRQEPSWGHTVELSFCIIFLCDLLVRMALAKRQFFTGRGRWWNLLDTVTVVLFVAKFLVASNSLLENLSSAFRILRMVRLFRILWALRVGLAHSSQLRQFRILLESLSESMNVLFWLLILICGNVYIFSLVLTEGIWRLCPNPQTELMCHKFGTLTNSIMTLLQIQYSGFLWGSLWDEITTLPWLIEATFLTFVAVSLLVLANTITSFICSLQTIVSKRERDLLIDKELEYNEKLVEQLYNIFHELDTNGNGAVSWTEFQLALQDERMHAFLSTLELDMSDAKKIFHILASEETNAIEESDFLLGCLRMRGGASGVDMVRIIMEQEWMHNAMVQTRTMLHKITRFLATEHLASQDVRNSREQMSETSSVGNRGIDSFDPDEPFDEATVIHRFEDDVEDTQIHAFQRSSLLPWQRAVTLQELLTIRSDLPRLCNGWRSERTGHHLVPEKTNLYDFAYHYILPQTTPPQGLWLRLCWDAARSPPAVGQQLLQVSEDTSLPKAVAIICQVEVTELQDENDGRSYLDLLVDLKRGRFLTGPKAPGLCLDIENVQNGDWSPAPEKVTCNGLSASYKELLSTQPCVPVWYCSHWWGEPIFEFVSGCRRHAEVRHLVVDARYWVCGYANRQHELDQEISANIVQTSFYAALREAKGLLLILDPKATPFSRIWCDFELYTAIMSRDMGLDIVTTIPPRHGKEAETRMLSKDLVPGESAVAKSVREQNFPINILAHGLEVMLENGMATQEEDKQAILDAIATEQFEPGPGKPQISNELRANMTLHSTLAILAWPQAMNRGLLRHGADDDDFDVEGALRSDVTRDSVELSLAHFEKTCVDAGVKVLAECIPPNISNLKLSFEGCHQLTDASLHALASHLPKLRTLYLDFVGCENLTDVGMKALAESLPETLVELELHFVGCIRLNSSGLEALSSKLQPLPSLRVLKLTYAGTRVNRNFASRAELRAFVRKLDVNGEFQKDA